MDVAELALQADEAAITADLRALAGEDAIDVGDGPVTVVSRNIHHADCDVAGRYVERRMTEAGADVSELPFEGEGESLYDVVGDLPSADGMMPADADGDFVLLGAHYDSTAKADESGYDPATDPAPGADDDAAGVAAILDVVRLLGTWSPGFERPVRVVAWSGEEEGLLGSYAYVEQGEPLPAVMVQLDPAGYNPASADRLWFAYDVRWPETKDDLDATAADVAAAGGPLTVTGVDGALIGDDRSDHYPFWDAGVPAVHLGDFPLAPTYHTKGDTFAVCDPAYTTAVAGLVAAHVATLAGPLSPPEKPHACGCATSSSSGAVWASLLPLLLLRRADGGRRKAEGRARRARR